MKEPKHSSDHSQAEHGFAALRTKLIILAQAPVLAAPREGAFHHPSLGQHDKAFLVGEFLDNLQRHPDLCGGLLHPRPPVGGIGIEDLQPRCLPPHLLQEAEGSFSVWQAGGRDGQPPDEAQRVDEHVALAAFDELACVKANSLLRSLRPPFSVVLTDWLSTTRTEGVASLPACVRTCSRKAS
jgi:hypothetical protein